MNYLLRLFSSGAIRKTPRSVLRAIAAEIAPTADFDIIEAGAGHGEITGCVIAKISQTAAFNYYAFEIDEQACAALRQTFSNIHVVPRSAFEMDAALPDTFKTDVFISSIPLSFYGHGVLKKFLIAVKKRLKSGGKIIIVFSAPWLVPFLRKQLPGIAVRLFPTLPFYFVGVYTETKQEL